MRSTIMASELRPKINTSLLVGSSTTWSGVRDELSKNIKNNVSENNICDVCGKVFSGSITDQFHNLTCKGIKK